MLLKIVIKNNYEYVLFYESNVSQIYYIENSEVEFSRVYCIQP